MTKDIDTFMPDNLPTFTKEDFMSTTPYEYLYSTKDVPFVMEIERRRLQSMAESAGFKGFLTAWKLYLQAKQTQTGIKFDNATLFTGQELELFSGEYICDDGGVTIYKGGRELVVCPHPIMPVERLVNIDNDEERLRIAYKKGRTWRDVIVPKSTIASSSAIIELSGRGVVVNSENAKELSTYLLDIEQRNYEEIPETRSVSRLGWVGEHGFSPYVEDLTFDGEQSFQHIFSAVTSCGDYDKWKDAMLDWRKGSVACRLALAAGFASAILEPCNLLPFFLHFWGGTENGKAQPLDTKIITPDGYKLMGEISVGDFVIGGDGKPHKVVGVYPQGKKDIYKITFKDGTSTRCCKEHLWNVTTRTRRNHDRGYTTLSLEEMLKRPIKTQKGYTYRIPVCKPVEYSSNPSLPIPAYAIGALIGDGCLTLKKNPSSRSRNIYFSNTENDVITRLNDEISALDVEFIRNQYTQCQYVLRGNGKSVFVKHVEDLGLNCKSTNKFIPEMYLFASVEDRKKLLAGLLDTDGFVGHEKHAVRYSTKSKKLSDDVKHLCQSLGYRCTVIEDGRGLFTLCLRTDSKVYSSKKHTSHKSDVKRVRKEDKTSMAIVSVKPCGREVCQCIMLDSEEHTYLCDDFIVTHNTVGLMVAASIWANPKMGEYCTTFNSTAVGQEMMASFLNSLPMCIDELQIQASQGVRDFDKIIYQLTEGIGKTRGTKTGGLQRQNTWKCCFLTSGEQPITTGTSFGGAINRIIEYECGEKIYHDLVGLCQIINHNYGFAGQEFVWNLQQEGVLQRVNEMQKEFYRALLQTDSTDKQAASVSAILTADTLATEWIFKDGRALTVDDLIGIMAKRDEVNANVRAYEYVLELIERNPTHFIPYNGDFSGELWGKHNPDHVAIFKSVFDRELANAGYNPTAFLAWAKRAGKIQTEGNRRTKKVRFGDSSTNCVCIVKESFVPDLVDEDDILP